MRKIIHLSDIHIGYKGMSTIFDGMIDRLIYLYQPADEYVIVITGDLVNNVTRQGQLSKAKAQIKRIREAGFNLLIAPGNHDYGTGSNATARGMKKYKKTIYGSSNKPFPIFTPLGNIAFIGIDSMEGEIIKNQGALANGEIGKRQLAGLEERLSSQPVKNSKYTVIYLHHHPIDMGGLIKRRIHGLDDAKKLKKILAANKIDALLFGHNHDGKPWNGSWGIKRVYDAGSSTGKKSQQGPHRVIDLSKPVTTDFDAQL
jgi:3',5'-cyclic AMP phosphodiesterase CpdA